MRATDVRPVSHADVLEGLRQTLYRQVLRGRHPSVHNVLFTRGLIDWVRQPERTSRYLAARPARPTDAYRPPIEIAMLSAAGRATLDWLTTLERSAQWAQRRVDPFGE